jgi:hypothetical protein
MRRTYYGKLGIKHHPRVMSVQRGSFASFTKPKLVSSLSKNNHMNQTQENMDIGFLQNKIKKRSKITRSNSKRRLRRYQSLNVLNIGIIRKKDLEQESKDNINNNTLN